MERLKPDEQTEPTEEGSPNDSSESDADGPTEEEVAEELSETLGLLGL